mmetsp:Transcript_89/g.297  ORF Transcript_89/g.297 Transcript_89/m.297 type:complete len:200 (+) Transcript_89:415-1014(+)
MSPMTAPRSSPICCISRPLRIIAPPKTQSRPRSCAMWWKISAKHVADATCIRLATSTRAARKSDRRQTPLRYSRRIVGRSSGTKQDWSVPGTSPLSTTAMKTADSRMSAWRCALDMRKNVTPKKSDDAHAEKTWKRPWDRKTWSAARATKARSTTTRRTRGRFGNARPSAGAPGLARAAHAAAAAPSTTASIASSAGFA